jgi:thiol-disulfide isomerase/thioredoxin
MIRALLFLWCAILATPCLAAGKFEPSTPREIDFRIRDRGGGAHEAREFFSRATLVHFWASWCLPCREELPALARLQADLRRDGVQVVTISLDRLGWDAIDRTVEKLGVSGLALFHDLNREAATALNVRGLPTTILVDAHGRETARLHGQGDWDDAALRRDILSLVR